MKRMTKTFLLAALFAIAALAACKPAPKKDAGTAAASSAAPVRAVKVARQRVTEKITYTATLEAWRKITITPEVGGKIARINVQEGDRVAAGQLLAEMDTESIRLQLRQAEAGQAVAQAAEADARRNKERLDRLFAENAVSAQQREQVGPVDVLMIPVGGFYTLEPAEAVEVAKALATKVVLPMHYKTPALDRLPIATAEDFLGLIPAEWKVERPDACVLNLREDDLPAGGTRVVLPAYE